MQTQSGAAVKLNFFMLARPNNLLGKFALEKLWLTQYRALRDVASLGSAVASMKLAKKEVRSPKKENIGEVKTIELPMML